MEASDIAVWLLAISFLVFVLLRLPVAQALFASSVLTMMYLEVPLPTVGQQMINGVSTFSLLAIPFFILTGQIMGEGGLAQRLVNLATLLVGRIRGGLALVNCIACMFFGNISGSAGADAASVGSVMIPAMKKKGYDADYAVGLTISSAIQGVVVPPSHNLVLYSIVAGGLSIKSLFLGGVVPGFMLLGSLMTVAYLMAIKRGYPASEPIDRREVPGIVFHGLLSLSPAFIILGGIISGVFTATESGALAVLYSFILAFGVYREVPLERMWNVLRRTLRTVLMVYFLIAASAAFGYVMAYLSIPDLITDWFLSVSDNKYVILLMINILLLILGGPMDMAPMILILTPVLLPVCTAMGMDPVHFGLVLIFNAGMGLLTPPVGTVLFIGCAIGRVSIAQGTKAMMPFFYAMLVVLLLITYIPQTVLWLPSLFK
ncbi:tripartite ATP-independent transporter DctM subunit [Anaerospora hongkongensis]|uniref:Tripartite ATP-independent transporter DctM subunit n=1 Tax=Anaerospora hongkongensis TaxID=244830 RepID=A0A4R1PY51_9FIRM|nr:TRAP transporter large permease [Anaerospora hongkongensis]TCL37619.1 tripartite ATP-independent transporter DctM subunit [Anaerospora hongkongensis]